MSERDMVVADAERVRKPKLPRKQILRKQRRKKK
jgi:hypothetical protein